MKNNIIKKHKLIVILMVVILTLVALYIADGGIVGIDKITSYNIHQNYKYSANGKNIYVDYGDIKTLKILNYHYDNFDATYMSLNNCVPVSIVTSRQYLYRQESRTVDLFTVVDDKVICLKDFNITKDTIWD